MANNQKTETAAKPDERAAESPPAQFSGLFTRADLEGFYWMQRAALLGVHGNIVERDYSKARGFAAIGMETPAERALIEGRQPKEKEKTDGKGDKGDKGGGEKAGG